MSKTRKLYIVFHGDLDGVVSAALVARWCKTRGLTWEARYSPVRALPKILRETVAKAKSVLGRPGVVVVDLAIQSLSDAILYATLLRGLPAAWFDHHPWPEGAADRLLRAGVEVYHVRDMVTAEIVAKTLGLVDDYSKVLVEAAKADDNCLPGESIADKWRIVLRSLQDPSKAVKSLVEGDLWPQWAEELYKRKIVEYMETVKRIVGRAKTYYMEGFKIAVIPMEPNIDVCSVQKELWKRGWDPTNIDIEVYVYPRALSLRSNKHDVACVARKLGGGGHSRAAGAPKPSQSMGDAQLARLIANTLRECIQSG